MCEERPILGITMGDPAGIGPEIIARLLAGVELQKISRPLVIGDASVMEWAVNVTNAKAKVIRVEYPLSLNINWHEINVLDLRNVNLSNLKMGEVSAEAGRAAYEYVEKAIHMALEGEIEAIVTAPLNKEALHAGGYPYSGHTEILAELCGASDVSMMLTSSDLRVSHVSTHVSLREACELVTKERVLTVIELTHEGLMAMGIERPRIAVAGLNPHAGEGGVFGSDEIREIHPAVLAAREKGINVDGPFPGDTIFFQAIQNQRDLDNRIDCVVAMYHNQGHIPLKLSGFYNGVNITLGLPIIRTSVDHGTAFDIVGKGIARPDSLHEAIKLAVQMVKNKKGL